MPTPHRFAAFLSYSHLEPDGPYAARLQAALERQWIPAGMGDASAPRRRVGRVFRDTTEMGSAPRLEDAIAEALRDSDHLILIASPQSAASPWIDLEVQSFLEQGRGDRIIVVDLDRHIPDALPPSYREHVARNGEPLRVPGSSQAGASGRVALKDTTLRIAHRLVGCNLDDLVQRVATEDSRKRRVTLALGVAVIAALAVLASVAMFQRDEARTARGQEAAARRAAEDSSARLSFSATSQAIAQRDVAGAERFLESIPPGHESWVSRALTRQLHQCSRAVKAHGQRITALAASRDGRHLATLDQTGLVKIWDRSTLTVNAEFSGADPDTRGLAFTEGGSLLVGGPGGTVIERTPDGTTHAIPFVQKVQPGIDAMAPNSRTVIAVFPDVAPSTHLLVHRLGFATSFRDERRELVVEAVPALRCVVQSAAVMAPTNGPPRIRYGLSNGATCTLSLPLPSDRRVEIQGGDNPMMVTSIWDDPSSDRWATGDLSGKLTLFQGAQTVATAEAHTGTVYDLQHDSAGNLWSTGRDGTVASWGPDGRLRARLLAHRGIAEGLTVCPGDTPNQDVIYSVDQQGWLMEWPSDRLCHPGVRLRETWGIPKFEPSESPVNLFISASGSDRVLLGARVSGEERIRGKIVDLGLRSVVVDYDGVQEFPVATVSSGRLLVQILDAPHERIALVLKTLQGEELQRWALEGAEGVSHVGLTADGALCGLSSGQALAVSWDDNVATRISVPYVGSEPLQGLQVAPDPTGTVAVACHLAESTRDSKIHFLDLASGQVTQSVDFHSPVSAFAYDPHQGSALVAVAQIEEHLSAGVVRVAPDGSQYPLELANLPPTMVLCLAVHPKEPLLAVALGDGIVAMWSLTTGQRLVDLTRMDGVPYKLEWSPDGNFLFAETPAGESRFWDGTAGG